MIIDYIEAFFLDDMTNELNIVTSEKAIPTYRLFWSYNNNKETQNKTEILKDNQKQLNFTFEYDKERRQYFILEFEQGETYLFGHRILPIAGMYNFRDFGGYRTQNNKRVKWSIGYRSDYLYNLDDVGLPYLLSLGLKTIIDFRSPEEVADRPNKDIGVRNFVFDPQAHLAQLAGALQVGESDGDEEIIEKAENEAAGDVEMIAQQEQFVEGELANKAFSNTLHVLADPNAIPVMLHCRGGKDRTGFGIMLLLGILGVDEEMLIYDYMLTHRARKEKNASYYEHFLEVTGDEDKARYMYALFDTKPEYIKAAIDKITAQYGTIRQYAQEVLGITAEEIATLEAMFLE